MGRLRVWLSLGTAVLVIVGCGDGSANRPDSAAGVDSVTASSNSSTTDPTVVATLAPTSSAAPTTTATPPSTATTATPPSTATPAATTSVPPSPGGGLAELLDGVAWEESGIARACVSDGVVCTQVAHDPSGAPISYDPTTRTLTRHVRHDGEFVAVTLPDSFGDPVWLVAAGPDEMVYLNAVHQLGAEGSADLVALTLAPGDAGREIDRFVGYGNPGIDFDYVLTPEGLVTTDWYGQGRRPAADALMIAWVDRDPDDGDSPASGADGVPNGVESITIDAYERLVSVGDRTWELTGPAAEWPPTGMPPIVRTFDGGFIARYDEVANEYRTVVVRGWPDGSLDQWLLRGGPDELGWTVVPEPTGTVLVPDGERFVRVAPFGAPVGPMGFRRASGVGVVRA